MKKILLILLALLIVSICIGGCKGIGEVAATVNGKEIYIDEVERELKDLMKNKPKIFSGERGKELEEEYRKIILDSYIDSELTMLEAEKMKISITDEEIRVEVDKVANMYTNKEDFVTQLNSQGLTLKEFEGLYVNNMTIKKTREKIAEGIEVTEKEAKEYYEENKEEYYNEKLKEYKKFEDVKNDILDYLKKKKEEEKIAGWLKELREQADVEIFI